MLVVISVWILLIDFSFFGKDIPTQPSTFFFLQTLHSRAKVKKPKKIPEIKTKPQPANNSKEKEPVVANGLKKAVSAQPLHQPPSVDKSDNMSVRNVKLVSLFWSM